MTMVDPVTPDPAMPDTPPEGTPDEPVKGGFLIVELGNARAHEKLNGLLTPIERHASAPAVSYLLVPQGDDRDGNPLYTFPANHSDDSWPEEIRTSLAAIPDSPTKSAIRRMLVEGWLAHSSGVRGLPDHEAFVAVVHPGGFWKEVSLPEDDPTWVNVIPCQGYEAEAAGLQGAIADHYGIPQGRPLNFEDTHWTQYGGSVYPPGAAPDPASFIQALHTSIGRDVQAISMGGFGYLGTVGQGVSGNTPTATTFAGSAETGVAHATNDCNGQLLEVNPNSSGTGSKVWGLITGVTTSGTFAGVTVTTTAPGYTVDQWYNAASPGGAAGATPNTTGWYQVVNTTPPAQFVALTTDSTTPSLGGSAGTADAASITQTLTSEIFTASGGLNRKIGPIGHTAAAATWTNTPVFTANGSDTLPKTVAKAALCVSNVAQGGGLMYMTLVSPTATISASGDQLTLTWTFTMT